MLGSTCGKSKLLAWSQSEGVRADESNDEVDDEIAFNSVSVYIARSVQHVRAAVAGRG